MAYHLLLADDDLAVTAGLRAAIEKAFPEMFSIHEAADGLALMQLLHSYPASLVITDVKMPGMDGLACLAYIRDQQLPCEVILLSGFDDYSLIRRALKLAAYDYLLKPVHIDSLLTLLNGLLPKLATLSPRTGALPPVKPVPETNPYFDAAPPARPLTAAQLEEALRDLTLAVQNMDGERTRAALNAFFTGHSPAVWDEPTVKAALAKLISDLMERVPAMIRIVGEQKLSELDAVNSIRNLPTFSQLHARFVQIFELYLSQLAQNTEKRELYMIRRAKEQIDSHYMEPLSLDDLAETLHMNPTYFSAMFKKLNGTTFRDYLRSVRIREGIRLIEAGERKLYEIADLVGYQNASHFNRAFKEVTGVTPSLWALHHPAAKR